MDVAVLGAGVFGAASALALAERGHRVVLYEAGTVPRPEAASTDLNKLVRMDYGTDRFYRDLGAEAIDGWERWNLVRPLYHGDGMLFLASSWAPGGFERDSHDLLLEIGQPVERFDRVPLDAWRWDGPGYTSRRAGWAESARVVAWLVERAVAAGVTLREHTAPRPDEVDADTVVVAGGVWSIALAPELRSLVRVVAQPVWVLAPTDPERWRAPRFLPWAADIAGTGWYGFPATADGLVKIANHGPGTPIAPDAPRTLDPSADAALRTFLRARLPGLAEAPVVRRRTCAYTDVVDGDFVIDRSPSDPRLVFATGGSGHAFKFAPVLGELVANRVDGTDDPRLARFRWRAPTTHRAEAARYTGESST